MKDNLFMWLVAGVSWLANFQELIASHQPQVTSHK